MRTMSTTMKRLIASLAVIATLIVGLPLTGVVAYADDQIVGNADENTVIQTANETPAQPAPQAEVSYKTEPYRDGDIAPKDDNSIAPGFKWVPKSEGMPAHYEIYNPVGAEWTGSTESAIGWWYFSYFSKTHDFDGYLIQLAEDISFKNWDWQRNSSEGRKQLTVGRDKDLPFKGTFDGQGHTLYNLTNPRDGLLIDLNCGFFGYTKEAVVKNVNFYDCYVGSSYNGALVVGDATDTLIMNVTATKCTTSVIPPNNVINLITNAGMSGGMIVGNANGSTLYNCEMRGGTVVTNATAGVGALGGQPLYLGGLVGYANDTVIEYSRVADYKNDDGTYTPAYVKNQYGTAVSVANYSEIFTGGIVGAMQAEDSGSKVVDCYSTADVYSEAAIYFGVGLGLGVTRGYTGGIAGMVRTGAKKGNDAALNLIQRVSFAGNLHSYNYNIILLGIPAIEHDKYMGGITGRGGENATIADAYYMRHRNNAQGENSIWGSTTDEDIYDYKTSYDGGVNDGVNFGDRDDQYTDRNFWESCDFDFAESKLRNLGYDFTTYAQDSEWSNDHYNKWIMDYDRGIPVHGGSIKATLDFPGSGATYIGYTSMASRPASVTDDDPQTEPPAQSTANPYDFAVQGFQEGVGQTSLVDGEVTHADVDQTIRLTFERETEAPADSSWASDKRNVGYRFMGWYRSRDVRVNDIVEDHNLFTTPNATLNTGDNSLISDGHKVQENTDYSPTSYTLDVNKPATDEGKGEKTDYYDNDLYLAYAQAQALLHNTAGSLVKFDGTETESDPAETDWYDYGQTLTLPSTVAGDEQVVADGGTLVGWTTRANPANGTNGAYTNATSSDLTALKSDKVFFEVGTEFAVTEPENLYPVYASLGSNVTVVFEGHDQDVSNEGTDGDVDDVSKRDGFGQAFVRTDTTDGDTRYYVTIDDMTEWNTENGAIQGDNKITSTISPISENYNAADTGVNDGQLVRFLGWYETVPSDDGDGTVEVRVSDQPTFYLDDVDLTQEHTYTARFEYCVRYWWDADTAASDNATTYSTDWVRYDADRYDPSIDGEGTHTFTQWMTGGNVEDNAVLNPYDASANQKQGNQASSTITKITYPFSFHGTWDDKASGANVEVNTDFPTGPGFTLDFDGSYNDTLIVDMPGGNEHGYNFHLWSGENNQFVNTWKAGSTSLRWDASNHYVDGVRLYWFEARVTADVVFHGIDTDGSSDGVTSVERQYEDNALKPDSTGERTYYYHLNNDDPVEIDGVKQKVTIAASPTDEDMQREGYIFLGWIDKNAISEGEFNYIFNGEQIEGTDVNLVKDVSRAKPYIMDGTEVVRHPMDLYPVYTTFIVETDTNVNPDNVAAVDETVYNIPNDPTVTDGKINEGDTPQVSLNYNKEGGPLPKDASPVDITYAGTDAGDLTNAKAKIVVTADTSTKVLTDNSTEDVYRLQSISVLVGNDVVETLTPDDKGSVTYTIEAGVDYTFRANYSPVPVQVVYHLDDNGGDGDLDAKTASIGDLLPSTTKTPTFDQFDSAFHVGWIVGGENGSVTEWTDQLDLAEPGVDTVTGTTHLWPVYRQGSVTVKSNIDVELINNGVADLNTVRTTKVRGDSLVLVAKGVEGYRFDGWYTGYTSDTERGTPLTTAYEYPLTGDARFNGATYTAVYTDMGDIPQVQYHDTGGNVIYTAYAEGEDEGRTFLDEVPYNKPVFDENGDPVLDENGNQVTQEVTEKVIIDLDAFNIINAELAAANSAEGAQAYEEFVTWQWVDNGEGAPERWGKNDDKENFINEKVSDNVDAEQTGDKVMHLYPVTIKLKATAPSDGAGGTESYLGGLKVTGLNRNEESDQLESANVTLLSDYTKPWLKVNLTEYAYNKGDGNEAAKSAAYPQENVTVNLYAAQSASDSPLATATTVADPVTEQGSVELIAGDALFTFSGDLTITKTVKDPEYDKTNPTVNDHIDGQEFVFTVADTAGSSREVTIKVSAEMKTVPDPSDPDKTIEQPTGTYTGTATIRQLPYGTYTVSEDDGWSWRYDVENLVDSSKKLTGTDDDQNVGLDSQSVGSVNVQIGYRGIGADGAPEPARVDCVNTLTNTKWFSGADHAKNVFGATKVGE